MRRLRGTLIEEAVPVAIDTVCAHLREHPIPSEVIFVLFGDADHEVYRSNVDYRLIAFGLFAGFGEGHSDRRPLNVSGNANLEEALQYYGWAALFSAHMPERYRGLSVTLEKLAENFETYVDVLTYMGPTT